MRVRAHVGRDRSCVRAVDEEGRTALHVAAGQGRVRTARYLLAAGAELGAGDIEGNRALHYAAGAGDPRMTRMLIETGADPNERNRLGESALHFAAGRGAGYPIETIEALVSAGAEVDAETLLGETLLGSAYRSYSEARMGGTEVIRALLARGASANAAYESRSLIERAVKSEWHSAAALLLENGAAANAGTWHDRTLVDTAAWRGDVRMMEMLVSDGAQVNGAVNTTGKPGDAPIHFAVGSGNVQAVGFLLENGAGINAQGDWGTPLYLAASGGDITMVRYLLEQGAGVNRRSWGKTPPEAAEEEGHEEVAALLRESGGS